ncbi:MAG: ADP-ribosylglycohydrolase family protein, partial [Muribaculaceae bacterium]|nr:ADP-ribosylglycohydrolase family protein [Muribaculaceae bacterium]
VSSFEEGLLAIVNEGGDADTNGAIACAILGAKFGYSSIPRYYIENLNNRAVYHQMITSFINQITDEKVYNFHLELHNNSSAYIYHCNL